MGIDFGSIKKILQHRKINLKRNRLSLPYPWLIAVPDFCYQNATPNHPLKPFASTDKKDHSLRHNALLKIHFFKPRVNPLKNLVINNTCISRISTYQSISQELFTFKMMFSNVRAYANSIMNPLFTYNCKNIFVHFFERTILLF